ncbi:MAG: prevent-host-death family protein [Thermoanaerobaculia bacterium]|nr:prevent-host-death family protein [Thermoanaerobaculia bacterium]
MVRAASKKASPSKPESFGMEIRPGEPVLVRHGRKAVAAVISMEDYEVLRQALREEEDRLDAEAARVAMQEPGSVPLDVVRKRLGL